MSIRIVLALLATVIPAQALAQPLVLAPALGDGAVLQRGEPVAIAGRAAADAAVIVTLGDTTRSVRADSAGDWHADFPAMPAATGLTLTAASGDERATARDLAVGDVYLCSGQSNMQFAMNEAALPPGERKLPVDASIRLLSVPIATARSEQRGFAAPAAWTPADQGAAEFSAVCLIAGRALARSQQVTVGLIDASMGGTPIESWLPYDGLAAAGGAEEGLAILDAFRRDPAAAEAEFGARLDAMWQMPPPPGQPAGRPRMGYANLFNAMIAPLGRMRLAGAIWYQGENNANRPEPRAAYRRQLTALLASWRARFGPDLPFVIIQLAPFGRLSGEPDDHPWAEVREAQRQVALADPHAELVTTVDVGERLDIHPPLKKPVGQRAATALGVLRFGLPREALGPRPVDAVRIGNDVRIGVAAGEGGLMAASWGRPGPFILCDSRQTQPCAYADARLVEGGIAVSIPAGQNPELVRYCWGAAPICNVFDKAQQPLPAFEMPVTPARQDTP